MFSKQAAWRVAANEIFWWFTEPRVLGIRLACLWAYLRATLADKSQFTFLSEADFQASRKSERVFVFGSGWSLNEIPPEGWAHMAQHDTFGFSMFVYQKWIRTDYHMLRELYVKKELDRSFWLPYSQEFAEYFDNNPYFDQTILLAQSGWRSLTANRMIMLKLFKKPRRLLLFRVVKGREDTQPSLRLRDGIVHGAGSLTDAINLAAIAGWKHIILVGVDLYDARYFWDDAHLNAADFGIDPNGMHNTVRWGIIENIARWRDILAQHGITLWVYNPKSLLTSVLPIYDANTFPQPKEAQAIK